ncbi:hypothetical protein L5515_014688 [Caenorhabditis briggsae]|nr:hypothetical protein L5515_014688 [Caenorhabditis briggsae]
MSGGKSGTKLSSFKNLQQIGQGGFGVVYSAQRENGEKVAIKKIGNAASQTRIKEEIKTMKLLRHRNIVQFYETFFENGETYLVMELCEGGSLMDYVKQKGPLDDSTAVHILRQLIAAVKYIHDENILHRDLSAGNVFIKDATKSTITVKLGDFGLATNLGQHGTACTIVGTPGFIAPQVFGQNYDQAADVYSLGAVLYTMLTKHTPPTKGPPNLESLKKRNPSAADLVERMMHTDARRRIQLKEIVMTDYVKAKMGEATPGSREHSRDSRSQRSREPFRSSRDGISLERRPPARSSSQPVNSRRDPDGYRAAHEMPTTSRTSVEPDRARVRHRLSARGIGSSQEDDLRQQIWPIRMERLVGQRVRTPGGRYIVEMNTRCRFEVVSKGNIVLRILVVEYDPHLLIQTVYVHKMSNRVEHARNETDDLIELTRSPISYTSLSQLPKEVMNDYMRLEKMMVSTIASRVAKITHRRPSQFPDASAQLMENGDLRIRFPNSLIVRRKSNGEVHNYIDGFANNKEEVRGLQLSKVREVYACLTQLEQCLSRMNPTMKILPMVFSAGPDIVATYNNSPSSILPSTSSQASRFPFSEISSSQQLVPHSAPIPNKPLSSRTTSSLNVRNGVSSDENTAPAATRQKYKARLDPVTGRIVSVQAEDNRKLRCSTSKPDQFIFTDPSISSSEQRFMRNGRVPERASEMLHALLVYMKKKQN